MITVYYFSAAGHSRNVAQYFSDALNAPIEDICALTQVSCHAETAVVVFPVYCQSIPAPVRSFLSGLTSQNAALIATYGRMGYGNVLWEAARLVRGTVIAGAFVPTGHSYLPEAVPLDSAQLVPIVERIRQPRQAVIRKAPKALWAGFFPGLRSRLGIRLHKNDNCTNCGICAKVCPMRAMENSHPNAQCIRCLRCVASCPEKALEFSCHPILRHYLRKIRQDTYTIYL